VAAGDLKVVVEHPPDRLLPGRVRQGLVGHGVGETTEQVVQPVPARCGLFEQVHVDEVLEQPVGQVEADAGDGRGEVGVDARAGEQAEQAEQSLRVRAQALVRQRERGPDAAIPSGELVEPWPSLARPPRLVLDDYVLERRKPTGRGRPAGYVEPYGSALGPGREDGGRADRVRVRGTRLRRARRCADARGTGRDLV
jgi:hypothetical protein